MDQITLSIIIPAYNEEKTIVKVIHQVWETPLQENVSREIIIVDDGSKDATVKVVKEFLDQNSEKNIRLIECGKNRGKGAAIREGIKQACGKWIIIQDADMEYNPRDYNILLQPALEGYADVVYGSRFVGGNPHRILFFWHSIGNKFLTFISNAFTNLNLTDMETGYKLFRADIIKSINLEENRFGFETEVTAKIARIPGIRIYEVGIAYYGRTYAEGKKIKAKDGFRALYTILKYNLQSKNPRRPIALVITLLLLFIVGLKINDYYKDKPFNFTRNDAGEYYQYLPALFIHHDLGFGFLEKTTPDKYEHYYKFSAYRFENGRSTGKMSLGMAMILTPGFLIAHGIAILTGLPADGFSPPYQWAILLTNLLFLGLGIYFTLKTLFRYFDSITSVITIVMLVLATNVLAYVYLHPGFSHIFTFGLMGMLLYVTDTFYRKPSIGLAMKAGLLMGFISLIRPSNTIVGLLFLLWGTFSVSDLKKRFQFFIKNYHLTLIIAAGIVIVWLPQMIYWKWVSGRFFLYTYGLKGERFFFGNPQIVNVLLSYRNGWLVYSPLFFLALLGFIFMIKNKNRQVLAIGFYFIGLIYIISSWWCWWYGGSFGARSLIDAYPALAFPLAAFFEKAGKTPWWLQILLIIVCGYLIHLNYYQSYQYSKGIIHWDGMSKEAYWRSIKEKHPPKDYYDLFVIPHTPYAKKGIYFEHDTLNIQRPPSLQEKEFIEKIKTNIRINKEWMQVIEEKAKRKGISVDSMLTLDARHIYKIRYHEKVPKN
ncbi:MAG TPA: glycosyltransferase family 2 protein [Bacteroidales bacterium]|jgi:glycosyltransferase involved in cell wall biosynthesis|nr:MAG: Undecaprenyl-phosphate mannosyltransferase [Bacteroidetes bacterium ADurb.Bin012]HNQ60382.1 glycosyltransferase family 2 protein [Bacteroidales bacterium]HNU22262.1 glycosyltransferase family 2 protein [Bacteroidales bacterium]HNV17742.1 glycosyltransferase family 2 protein [Bacteroidales bacterium]HNZ79894.1 glycosyltransferase family 2 protein [Bacteroidales bacterium]